MAAPAPSRGPRRTWANKFADAFRGVKLGMRGQSSFAAHLFAAVAVVIVAAVLRCTLSEWIALTFCITIVLVAEMLNTSIEMLARTIDRQHNPELGKALDVASAAVLIASLGAAIIGALVFLHRSQLANF